MIHPVILCGGSGTRLWPSSRKGYPKQFAPLLGESSLYQATLRRLTGPRFTRPLVMTNEEFRFLASQQAAGIGLSDAQVVVEPCLRDTAPAILVAALIVAQDDGDEGLMLVAPSDHVIADLPGFLHAVDRGAEAARSGALVTFGVTPDRPETGYGYLEIARKPDGTGAALPVSSFREKPDVATAAKFLEAGTYLWNAGIFLFRAADVIAAFEAHAPDLVAPARAALDRGREDLNLFRLDPDSYAGSPSISFDYAVMEKAGRVSAVPLDCAWSDLGAWDAIWAAESPDEDGLAIRGPVTAVDCRDSYLRSEEPGLQLVGLGLDGVVAVAMRDAVLVADKSRVQEVKGLVSTLRAGGVDQADDYPRFHRPWGWYETLCIDTRFQVKRIMVHPGGVLSLQSHHHRSEHWIVVSGTAEVTIGDQVKLVTENQSVYIPLGTVHRMANPGKLPMYLIEVQTGAYLGEDDIQRYEDVYGRG
ncbi:mannose-1-phosphate guanylyltransferase/mannose-6-phosphate isomerase [Tropicimonas sediminicola]|uniref:mannose-1-phosphate guanylyltransferase n=1 Tax=Tropicimonas sediminicola TaxID=1031541 RepID=A0A239HC77_9RHOB|nr:mannose-1-phosphate guanylyltransferase/mannose-6-phosphate isomerase [Tropicimonas sediminicola]SNS77864.1 mannose-1-phosphate guanylyltransferase/mannose-1-phosphate guanylyltransferase / mannose-6-phosphate isomerase [Tropicimonas sediminicola]